MLGKNFTFRGLSIPYTRAEGIANGFVADIEWKNITTRDIVQDRQDYHGVYASPSLANGRLITISGDVFDIDKAERGSIRNTIESIFQLEGIPKFGEGIYQLAFDDDDGTSWFINAKVRTPLEYSMDRGSSVYSFRSELFAQDPLIYGAIEKTASGEYGLLGGAYLPITLPENLASAINYFSVVNDGNFPNSPTITISGEITNPRVYNLTTGRYFGINQTMTGTDELVVKISDEDNIGQPTAKLNGVNVFADLQDGSDLLYVNSGTNLFLLTGDNFEIDNTSKATISITYRDTKL